MNNLDSLARDITSNPTPLHTGNGRNFSSEDRPDKSSPICADSLALDSYRLNMRVLHGVVAPDTSTALLNNALDAPVISGPGFPLRGEISEADGRRQSASIAAELLGCADAGVLGCAGDGGADPTRSPALEALRRAAGAGIPFFLPWQGQALLRLVEEAEKIGCPAIGIEADALVGFGSAALAPLTPVRLAKIVRHTPLPVLVSGIMTPNEARECADAGAQAIVVSHRHSGVLGPVPGVAEVLPWIAEAVSGRCGIIAAGGAHTGADVLKLLALGADVVMLGEPFAQASVLSGRDGVAACAKRIRRELCEAMTLTGTTTVRSVSRSVLYVRR